jgi:hypothetical protein
MNAVGFRVQLTGASLWDLVQMECLARSRRVVQVTGEGGIGYLFLADGGIVHASTSRLVGEPAALEILSWTNGSFSVCERPWPKTPTISTPCEALILRVAKRWDEKNASNLVAFPVKEIEEEGGAMTDADHAITIRLAPNGAVVKNSGGTEELAEALAYANRLVHLAGELLGLDSFAAMECMFGEGRWIAYVETNGDLVAVRPKAEANLQPLRARLGL